MEDDIPADVKQRRLAEVIALQGELSRKRMLLMLAEIHEILIEGISKKIKTNGKEEILKMLFAFLISWKDKKLVTL
jgi:tRNA-2-methylthio-N6-dimethylallyladenosine synthase